MNNMVKLLVKQEIETKANVKKLITSRKK